MEFQETSEQETRSGKNYLNTLAKYKSGEKVTVDGITYIFNEDGSITCNGTATADSVLTFSLGLQTINGSSKKIVGMLTGTQVPKKISILAYTSDWSKNTFTILSNVNKNITTNMQENIDYTIFRIIVYKGTTLNNQTIYYQILDTSVNDLTYEQYGAMPSPDYQSEVKSVGSNINILPSNLFSSTALKGINYTNKDGIITVNGTATENSFYTKTITLKAGTYTLNGAPKGSAQDRYCLQAQGLGAGDFGSGQTFTIDTEKQVTLRIMVWKGITVNNIIFKPKIIKGTVATPYSKFGQGCVKVTKCNKNLAIKNVKGYFSISDFKIKIDNNSESFLFYAEKGKEYTRSCKVNLDRNRIGKIDTLDVTQGMTVLNGQEINSKKFICDDSGIYIWFVNSTLNDSIKESFQIEESSTESSFEQHEEQSYIMPVQKEMLQGDYFDYDNEEEVHIWKKLILTGNEVFAKGYDKERVSGFYTSIDELKNIDKKRNDTLSDFLCNCLIEKKFYTNNISDEVWGNVNTFAFSTASQHILALNIENISTVDELKAYLKAQYDAGTPVMIYYKLQTPTKLAFTEEQKAVAKELNNARTYKNVTNITTDSKAILSLDYVKDQETQNQKMQNEIDEIKQLLSTTQTSALLLDNMQTDIESEVE